MARNGQSSNFIRFSAVVATVPSIRDPYCKPHAPACALESVNSPESRWCPSSLDSPGDAILSPRSTIRVCVPARRSRSGRADTSARAGCCSRDRGVERAPMHKARCHAMSSRPRCRESSHDRRHATSKPAPRGAIVLERRFRRTCILRAMHSTRLASASAQASSRCRGERA